MAKKKILVVDADTIWQELLEIILSSEVDVIYKRCSKEVSKDEEFLSSFNLAIIGSCERSTSKDGKVFTIELIKTLSKLEVPILGMSSIDSFLKQMKKAGCVHTTGEKSDAFFIAKKAQEILRM